MIMSEKLENGLVLEVTDKTKRIAEDRLHIVYLVCLVVSVKEYAPEGKAEEMEAVLGKDVFFEKKLERFFVPEKDGKTVSDDLLQSYLDSVKTYLSLPGFPEKFLIRQYAEAMKNIRP